MTQGIQTRQGWLHAERLQKEAFLKTLEGAGGHPFQFREIRTEQTAHGEQEIGILTLDGQDFVFVPADEVTLGWGELDAADAFIVPAITADLETVAWGTSSTLSALGYPRGGLDYLRSTLSPRRPVQIPPLLVERDAPSIIWRNGDLMDFSRQTDGYLDQAFPYAAVAEHIERQGFTLPTEDEWEYLCGGGTKRIFGDSIDEGFIRDLCTARKLSWDYISDRQSLRRPSGRGVYIAYTGYV
jgi:hypothetical protein